jgi:hypothetical protein
VVSQVVLWVVLQAVLRVVLWVVLQMVLQTVLQAVLQVFAVWVGVPRLVLRFLLGLLPRIPELVSFLRHILLCRLLRECRMKDGEYL